MDYRNMMSGADRGLGAAALRLAASMAEPLYAAATRMRNRMFDAGVMKSYDLGRPTISVGNLTAGGTGKTPMVCWLAEQLRARGLRVAILARGYKSEGGERGDEQRMLDAALNTGALSTVELITNPDRVAAATAALARDPGIDVFVLDDAFQHRRARRALDVVLLSAPEPFGFERLLPRGLLREGPEGLHRAGACVLTHCDQLAPQKLEAVERRVRNDQPDLPIYRTVHAHRFLKRSAAGELRPIDCLGQTPFFAFAGIGAPELLDHQLRSWGTTYRGRRWFPDHHHYTPADVTALRAAAEASGAEILVTTEKDWVKVADLPGMARELPILRIEMALQFLDGDESRFWNQIAGVIGSHAVLKT
jgi:tetraacyldisaccharide 4'-kinase